MWHALAAFGLLLGPPVPPGAMRAATRVQQLRLAERPVAAVAPESVGGPIEALIGAVAASKCGSINQLLVNAGEKETVLGLVTEYKGLMNAVNIATSLHRLASLEKKNRAERDALLRDPRFEALLDAVVKRAEEFTPRQTADLLWSFATLRHWPPMLLKPLLLRVVHHLDRNSFAPHQLSIVTWAFATLECKPVRAPRRCPAILVALAQPRHARAPPQAAAAPRRAHNARRQHADRHSTPPLSPSPPSCACSSQHHGARLLSERPSPPLIQVNLLVTIEKQAERACDNFNPQNCANLLWGFAKLQQPTATLVPAVAKRLNAKGLLLQCKPVEVRAGGVAGPGWVHQRAMHMLDRGCAHESSVRCRPANA
jgi:hypothetical protein